MKQLFLFLLSINIVYFFLGFASKSDPISVVKKTPLYKEKVLEPLVLLTNKAGVEQGAVAAEVFSQAIAKDCFVAGDFPTEESIHRLHVRLMGLDSKANIVVSRTVSEYWVTYSSNSDWQQALRDVEELKIKEVTELWLVPNGDYKGVVSLGVFVTEARANVRLDELREKQVNATILLREKSRYGVKVKTDRGVDSILDFLNTSKQEEKDSIRKIAC
ncbi:MAG: hypothetical protein ABGX33_07470 [Cycloclasticus sp.]